MTRTRESYVVAGKLAAETARHRYGDDFHHHRGKQAIASARANGKFPDPLVVVCIVCSAYPETCDAECDERGHTFEVPPSRSRMRRCPSCVARGLAVCGACGALVKTEPGRSGRARCEVCSADGRRGPGTKRKPRIEVSCRGPEKMNRGTTAAPRWVKLPWKVPRHPRCAGTRSHTLAQAKKLGRYDAKTSSAVCRACSGRENVVRLWLPRVEKAGYRPSSYDDFVAMQKRVARSHLARVPAWTERRDIVRQLSSADATSMNSRRSESGRKAQAQAVRLASLIDPWLPAEKRHRLQQPTHWELDLCAGCGKLLMRSTAPTARRVEFHHVCFDAYRRDRRERISALREIGIDERRIPGLLMPPPFKNDRHRSDTLTKHFSWAIRHLVCGETQEAIAGARSQAAVSRAIASIIDLLPDPALADARFRPHVLLLLESRPRMSAD